MDEAEITLSQSEIDDFLKLNEELHKANQQTQLAYQMRQQGKNISQNTFNELSIKQGSIMQKINLINAPLEDAIYIKREPEMRAKHIAAMKLQYDGYAKRTLQTLAKILPTRARLISRAKGTRKKILRKAARTREAKSRN